MLNAVTPVEGGRDLQLTYPGDSLKLTSPHDVPIVTFAPADGSDLKVGAAIFAVAAPAADGRLRATSVSIERKASSRRCSFTV